MLETVEGQVGYQVACVADEGEAAGCQVGWANGTGEPPAKRTTPLRRQRRQEGVYGPQTTGEGGERRDRERDKRWTDRVQRRERERKKRDGQTE